ncbi:hypothetical protein B4589_003145 [Halolamina sp. CBA1230]|uniref:hypothetical protein n=1 Tax=Halolamina sp. CBA1230 TaxID=1853690 RepID=UPI00117A3158|nr:hypothetical protein [Halolamina sp. CBA1230]QKY19421.1 hypothetical protein B4589_003145 [Halolamina sp. CBA1230]
MAGLSPFGGSDDATFDDDGEFLPEHLPEPGPFLADYDVLADEEHVAVHETAEDLFEERGVYDMTFGYNLARLNFDTRHPDAGFRYAEEPDDAVLRAEFTPTTAFCPQTQTLTVGAFRAWNGLTDRHEYDLVRVRAASMHQESAAVNEQLQSLEAEFRETGSVPDERDDEPAATGSPDAPF